MNDGCVTNVGIARAGLVLGRSPWMTEMAYYGLAVAARFLCILSLRRAAAKKVSAAPHRGEADMTPGVNRDRFSVFSFQTHVVSEFPEGDVASKSRRWITLISAGWYRITEVRPMSLPLSNVASRMQSVA
jgi:hypothetical protein